MTDQPSKGSSWIRQARRDYQSLESPASSVSTAELQALAEGTLEGAARLRVADAVIRDPKLAAHVQGLMRLVSTPETLGTAEAADSPSLRPPIEFERSVDRPGSWRRSLGGLALVAAALLAGILFVGGWDLLQPSGSRGAQPIVLQELYPADQSSLGAAPAALRWSPVAGAENYSVTIFDSESSPLWSASEVTSSEVLLPDEIRGRLNQPGSYLWRVDSRVDLVTRSSAVWRFTVKP